MRRRAAAPESARNTRMQGAPSHSPMAVPTTPGNAMSESVWAASTASIVFDVTARVSSRSWRAVQLASTPATSSVATVHPEPHRPMGLRPVYPDRRTVTVPVGVVVQRPIVGPVGHRHTHHRQVHGEDVPLEAREQHDARAVAAELARRARVGVEAEHAPVTHDGSAVQRIVIGGVHGAPSGASWSVTSKAPTFWLPTFFTVTPTLTVAPWVTDAGAVTLVTATSVMGAGGGGGAPPSTCTPKLLSTRSMRFAIVWVELPANRSPTGLLLLSSVTISDPESPPPENDPGSMTS